MKKNPIKLMKIMLAAEALSIMNTKKITALCVYKNKNKVIGINSYAQYFKRKYRIK